MLERTGSVPDLTSIRTKYELQFCFKPAHIVHS